MSELVTNIYPKIHPNLGKYTSTMVRIWGIESLFCDGIVGPPQKKIWVKLLTGHRSQLRGPKYQPTYIHSHPSIPKFIYIYIHMYIYIQYMMTILNCHMYTIYVHSNIGCLHFLCWHVFAKITLHMCLNVRRTDMIVALVKLFRSLHVICTYIHM